MIMRIIINYRQPFAESPYLILSVLRVGEELGLKDGAAHVGQAEEDANTERVRGSEAVNGEVTGVGVQSNLNPSQSRTVCRK